MPYLPALPGGYWPFFRPLSQSQSSKLGPVADDAQLSKLCGPGTRHRYMNSLFPRGLAASHVPPQGSGSALAGSFLLAFPLLQAPRVGRPTRGVEELDTAMS